MSSYACCTTVALRLPFLLPLVSLSLIFSLFPVLDRWALAFLLFVLKALENLADPR